MIITCKKEVPIRWISLAILPAAAYNFNYYVLGVAFLFSLKKFVENPAGLTFILSLPGFISVLLQPLVSFRSDRIWTRFGRRKPFVVTSQIGVATCLILMPLMPNFWSLLAVFMIYNVFNDLNSPMEPLNQEIIPPTERGRSTGLQAWYSNFACMTFYFVALGRFDDVRYMAGVPISGETVIYWSAGTITAIMILLVSLGIKEIDQKSALRGQHFSVRNFLGGLMDQELWPVYMLVIGSACLNFYAGLGPLSNLLYTDQWGYTKQEMGINVALGGVINMFAIGFLTFFADRFNRMRAYQTLITLSLSGNVLYYCYVNFVLPDRRPSLIEIIVFGETLSIVAMLTGLAYVPLVYDYVTRNKMGTYNAGAQMILRLTTLLTLNGVGLFVWAYAIFFQPPAGEMTRIVLRDQQTAKKEVLSTLRETSWTYPQSAAPASASQLAVNSWQGNGIITNTGRCWEIRLRDKSSEKLAAEKEQVARASSPLIADEKMLEDKAALLKLRGDLPAGEQAQQNAARKKTEIDRLASRTNQINTQLKVRAQTFEHQVTSLLHDRLLVDGEQLLAANTGEALVVEFAAAQRPDGAVLEEILNDLRRIDSRIIDLRPLKRDKGYGVAVSAMLDQKANQAALAHELQSEIENAAGKRAPVLFSPDSAELATKCQPTLTLDLMIVEDPLDTYVSPVTRIANAILAPFVRVSSPSHRLDATARNLRTLNETNHVRVVPGNTSKTISVTAVISPSAGKSTSMDDPIGRKLQNLLGANAPGDRLQQARAFYDRVEKAAATQRITVARPVLTSGYAPMKYDYMSGYLWMFFMSLIGISVTIAFSRFEAKGHIRKRGMEEAQAV